MSAELTQPQADAIAILVSRLRPDWDVRGVMAALAKVRDRDPFLAAVAAVRAAANPTNRTPAVIAMDGAHWLSPAPTAKPGVWQPPPMCGHCHGIHDVGAPCVRRSPGDYATGAEQARQALLKSKSKDGQEDEGGTE